MAFTFKKQNRAQRLYFDAADFSNTLFCVGKVSKAPEILLWTFRPIAEYRVRPCPPANRHG